MKNLAQAKTMGLIVPDKQLCLQCHNKDNPFSRSLILKLTPQKLLIQIRQRKTN